MGLPALSPHRATSERVVVNNFSNICCRCFEPDPDMRATTAELLEHPFLAE